MKSGLMVFGIAAAITVYHFAVVEPLLEALRHSPAGAKELVAVDLKGFMEGEYKRLQEGKIDEKQYLANVQSFIGRIKAMPAGMMVIGKDAAYANIRTMDPNDYAGGK